MSIKVHTKSETVRVKKVTHLEIMASMGARFQVRRGDFGFEVGSVRLPGDGFAPTFPQSTDLDGLKEIHKGLGEYIQAIEKETR